MKWQPEVIEWWYGVQPLAKKASKKREKKIKNSGARNAG